METQDQWICLGPVIPILHASESVQGRVQLLHGCAIYIFLYLPATVCPRCTLGIQTGGMYLPWERQMYPREDATHICCPVPWVLKYGFHLHTWVHMATFGLRKLLASKHLCAALLCMLGRVGPKCVSLPLCSGSVHWCCSKWLFDFATWCLQWMRDQQTCHCLHDNAWLLPHVAHSTSQQLSLLVRYPGGKGGLQVNKGKVTEVINQDHCCCILLHCGYAL